MPHKETPGLGDTSCLATCSKEELTAGQGLEQSPGLLRDTGCLSPTVRPLQAAAHGLPELS